jgi:hypothetical protein
MESMMTAAWLFGLVGGYASSEISVSSDVLSLSLDSRPGFAAGVSASRDIGGGFTFAPELLYVQKGFEINDEGNSVALKLNYIELPLLFRADFGSGSAQPFVMGGPVIAFKASCNVSGSNEEVDVTLECNEFASGGDDEAEFKSVDYGVMFGAGLQFGRVSASVRYDLGLANVIDVGEDISYKNRSLMILLGLRF